MDEIGALKIEETEGFIEVSSNALDSHSHSDEEESGSVHERGLDKEQEYHAVPVTEGLGEINPYTVKTKDDDEASVTEEMENIKSLPQADGMGNLVEVPDDVTIEGEKKRSILSTGLECFKYLYSMILLIFCIALFMGCIFVRESTATNYGLSPLGAFFLFWFLICWLAMMEGGQGCLVGLQPTDRDLYAETHPRTLKNTAIAHKGDNMERFIVGRQFLVVLIIFLINMCGSAIQGADPFGLPKVVNDIFLSNGIAMMITTVVIGQLTSQVNAALCMLDFINNYFMLFTTFASLAIEFSGLLHCVYLVQIWFSKVSGEPMESNEPPRSGFKNIFFWARVLMSTVIVCFALAITIDSLIKGQGGIWDEDEVIESIIVFFALMCVIGLLEGMQIAAFALLNMPDEELQTYNIAYMNCKLIFTGNNLQAFLVGRQILVTYLMFFVARITMFTVKEGEDDAVPGGFKAFLDTGFLGALVLTIIGSLAWRIVASSYPRAFMSNPLITLFIRICLFLEASGICSSCWVLARVLKLMAGYQPDEVYLEGAEKEGSEPITSRDKDVDRCFSIVQYTYSFVLLIFCVVIFMGCMFAEESTAIDYGIAPLGAFFLFWFLISWLAMMEGGQGCLVGLQSIDKDKYTDSHPRTLKNTVLAHKGDNMDRYIIGRQFLVVLIIFLINLSGAAIQGADPFGLPKWMNEIFLSSGVAMTITTIVIGQLTSQINASICMLDFINNYFMLLTTHVSLAIENSGLLHCVYLFQIGYSRLSGDHVESKEPPRSKVMNALFWCRVLVSTTVLCFALAVTIESLVTSKGGIWGNKSAAVAIVTFFVLMCVIGIMEGMQIAAFALLKMPEDELRTHTIAYANCKLIFTGQHLQSFLVGRQILVTSLMFFIAKITTTPLEEGENVFGVSGGVQRFFETGFLGAVVLTIIGSLAWRIIASRSPLGFMSNPLIYLLIRICLLLEATGVCSSSWVLARFTKPIVGYQPDEVYFEGEPKQGPEAVTKRDKDVDITVTVVKYLGSLTLLVFCVTIVMATIFTKQTGFAKSIHELFAFFFFWFLICWLAMAEGGQGCLVGLQAIQKELYIESHPRTLKNTELAHKGDNMARFIVGRQFLVVLIIFLINMCGSPITGAQVLGLSDSLTSIFLGNGVALMITTIVIGQLTAQVNAAVCMLDFINNYFMLFTSYASLAIEYSGLLHSVYLVQIAFSKLTGEPVESRESPRSGTQNLLFWIRVLISTAILFFALAVTIESLLQGQSGIWEGIPVAVSILVFFVLLCLVGLMDGMQIAAFALISMPQEELSQYGVASANCKLMFTGQNLQAFLIGRQIFVASLMFIVAKIATISVGEGEENIFGVPDWFQAFLDTGLLGAVVLAIIGSLIWRIMASSFPLAFMSNPLVYIIIRTCLIIEGTGIFSSAWLLALIHKPLAGYLPDEVYIEDFDDDFDEEESARV